MSLRSCVTGALALFAFAACQTSAPGEGSTTHERCLHPECVPDELSQDAHVGDDTSLGGDAPDESLEEPQLVREARLSGLLNYIDEGPEPRLESSDGDTSVFVFEGDEGPICMRGEPFRFSYRERGSDKLLVFLQGGGTCWSDFCLTVIAASAGIPMVDALDPDNPSNPMSDWNVLYLPYCDGSFFTGDRDFDENGDGKGDRLHRGLQNLSGALRKARVLMPDPERVLLTGSSAGAFGTIPATVLVRAVYPEATLQVFNDSGVGVARPDEPAFVEKILDEQGLIPLFPESCEACWGDGHITRLVHWIFERDDAVQMAVFSSMHDSVIAGTFLDIDADIFQETMLKETHALHERFPERYKRFIVQGVAHTTLLGTPVGIIGEDLSALEFSSDALSGLSGIRLGGLDSTTIGEVSAGDWLRAFVEGDPAWVDMIEPEASEEELEPADEQGEDE